MDDNRNVLLAKEEIPTCELIARIKVLTVSKVKVIYDVYYLINYNK